MDVWGWEVGGDFTLVNVESVGAVVGPEVFEEGVFDVAFGAVAAGEGLDH